MPSLRPATYRPTAARASSTLMGTVALSLCLLAALPDTNHAEERKGLPVTPMDRLPDEKLEELAELQLKLKNNTACRSTIETLLKRSPDHIGGLRLLARLEFNLGHFPQSVKAASVALRVSPDDADSIVIKAAALGASGQTVEADKLLSRLAPEQVARREDALDITSRRPSTRPADAAEGSHTSPVPDEADAADAALDAARGALARKDLKRADKSTAAALKQWPHNKDAIALRADFLSAAGRPAEAVALYRKLRAAYDPATGPFPQQFDLACALDDAGLTDEARRAYAVVIADKRYPAEDRTQAEKIITEKRRATLLAQGQAALERGDSNEARNICERLLLQEKTVAPDVQLFHADVLESTGRHAEAAAIYGQVKAATSGARRFDSQLDLAAALAGSRDYRGAAAAYDEVVLAPSLYTREEVADANGALDDLYEADFPLLAAEFGTGAYDEGRVWRTASHFSSLRQGTHRWLADVSWDRVELTQKLFPTDRTDDRFDATTGIEEQLDKHWTATVLAGGYSGGMKGSIAAQFEAARGLSATLRAAGNDPARDTLLLEAMDGRQHSIAAEISTPLGVHFAFDATLLARQIEIDGHSIGRAAGIESQFRWHPFTVKNDTWLAYSLEVKGFSARESAFDRAAESFFGGQSGASLPGVNDAVPDRINRHAFQAHTSVPLSHKLTAAATGEVAYREEVRKVEYSVVSELRWKIAPHSDLFARYEYDTGGAGPNTNGSVKLGSFGLRCAW